jgi:hypothetical protein
MSSQNSQVNTEERLTHQFISDVFMITNETGQQTSSQAANKGETKVYLPGISQDFTLEELDIIIIGRLGKQRDENKFTYLYEAYERIGAHLLAKRKNKTEQV